VCGDQACRSTWPGNRSVSTPVLVRSPEDDAQSWRALGLSLHRLDRPLPRELDLSRCDLGLLLRESRVRLGKSLLSFGEPLALIGDLLRVLFGIPCRRHLGTHCPMRHCDANPKTNAEDHAKSKEDYRP
jgi:hypothetical protein